MTARRTLTPAQRRRVLEARGDKCMLCHAEGVPLEIDHWLPLIFGGKNDDDNLRPLCEPCHKGLTRITVKQNAKVNRLLDGTKKREYYWPKRRFPKGRGFRWEGWRKKLDGTAVKV